MGTRFIWTKELLLKEALKYKTKMEFLENSPKAYKAASKKSLLGEICGHMPGNLAMKSTTPKEGWTPEQIRLEALKYKTRSEWFRKNSWSYYKARATGIFDACSKHMTTPWDKWTLEQVKAHALRFTTRGAWQKGHKMSYDASVRNGWLNECCDHMPINANLVSLDAYMDIAKKYKYRGDLWNEKPEVALWLTRRKDVVGKAFAHMPAVSGFSLKEKELFKFLHSLIPDAKENFVPMKENGKRYEIDCYCGAKKLGVEYNGLYWHSEINKPPSYHIKKRKYFNDAGIELIQINQDEWRDKRAIVESIIKAKLGLCDKKYMARNLDLLPVPVDKAGVFLKDNHLMGASAGFKGIGLYHNTDLICLLTYKKHGTGIDIARFCTKKGASVSGGLSRLIAHIVKVEKTKFIQSYVDLRYGNGKSLEKVGFKLQSTTLGWKWTEGKFTYNRRKCRANMDPRKLSEREYANELGWYKIYDAGQAKFIKTL